MFRSGSIIVFVCCLSAADCLQAQAPADTLRLDAVDITARPSSRQTPGATATEIDSAALHSACVDAAELLRMNSNAFIKSYSHAGSATLSVRGTEARHTAVLWHGMNINSPSMGITDVSLMPLTGISTMRLLQGGVASVYGNSSLGGTLILDHAPPSFDKSISLSGGAAAGSFSTWNAYGSADISGSRVQSVTGIRISGTANDFEYTDITKIDKPVAEQQHGSGNGIHITQDLHLRTGTNGVLTASAWYLTEKRNIPATMMEDYSTASQRDSILRTVLSWKKHFKKLAAEFSGAYFDEHQHYQDPKHQIDSKYNVRTWQGIASFAWQLSNKTEVTGGANYIYNRAAFEEYAGTEYRKNLVVYGGITHIPTDRIRLAFNFRKEFTENENPPFCPSIHLEADLVKSVLTFHASAAQNYSLPSMNDLYWQPGGNSELLPEESLSFECGLKLFRERPGKPEITATVYKAVTKNWIKWIPVDAGYYAATNLDEVETKGIELQGSYRYNRGKHSFFIHAGYAYTLASRTATAPENENLLGNQLIYTPRHSGVLNLSYSIFMWEVRYDQQYTGLRYTTEDHSSSLDAFTTADLRIARNLPAGKMNYSVFIKVMNLWDEQYQVMAWRPMPGRWVMAGVALQHIGKLKKQ